MLPSLPGTIGVIITWDYVEYRVGCDRHLHRDPLACGDTVSGNRVNFVTTRECRDTNRQMIIRSASWSVGERQISKCSFGVWSAVVGH